MASNKYKKRRIGFVILLLLLLLIAVGVITVTGEINGGKKNRRDRYRFHCAGQRYLRHRPRAEGRRPDRQYHPL